MNVKTFALSLLAATALTSAATQPVTLPAPETTGGTPLSEALARRKSLRSYDAGRQLEPQLLSNLLWSAAGLNRPDEGKRTNPTAINAQEIDLYLFTTEGVYFYDFAANTLVEKVKGDHRDIIAGTPERSQKFVMEAPVSVLIVGELSRYRGYEAPADRSCYDRTALMAAADAGIVSQNINLFCAANGLATVTRGTMDQEAIIRLLDLPATAMPLLNNPVGFPQ